MVIQTRTGNVRFGSEALGIGSGLKTNGNLTPLFATSFCSRRKFKQNPRGKRLVVRFARADRTLRDDVQRRTLIGGALLVCGAGVLQAVGTRTEPRKAKAIVKDDKQDKNQFIDGVRHFITGGIAGSIGAAAVYPIDTVKTRMQNERAGNGKEGRYKNGVDCFYKILRQEGPVALYQGLVPQLVGVWPEKAVKLAANDFMRSVFQNPTTGVIPLPFQILAGGFGGLCQVVFTNPLEIVKVRLQVIEAGRDGKPPSPIQVIKELGLKGLYKGSVVCASRDVPFSMIYFPTFAALKMFLAAPGPDGPSPLVLLLAGTLAGVPAAYMVTPMDVVKTRVQVEAREGEDEYNGPVDCVETIWEKEGPGSFYKGGVQRVLRSAPQFGVTLLVYELLNRCL